MSMSQELITWRKGKYQIASMERQVSHMHKELTKDLLEDISLETIANLLDTTSTHNIIQEY